MLDVISKPQTINKLITNIFSESETFLSKDMLNSKNQNSIQLLKHWSQMNGYIFKSVRNFKFDFFLF